MKKITINKSGVATRKLLKAIPEEDIQIMLDAYEEMKSIKKLDEIPKYPLGALITIGRGFRKMMQAGWIERKEAIEFIRSVDDRIQKAEGGLLRTNDFFKSVLLEDDGELKKGRRKNYALEILCSSLIYTVHAKVGEHASVRKIKNSHLNLIAVFLHEQKIASAKYFAYLKKGYRINEYDEIIRMINAIGNIRNSLSIVDQPDPKTGLIESWTGHRFNKLMHVLLKYKCALTKNSAHKKRAVVAN